MSHPDPMFDPENVKEEDIDDKDVPTLNDTLTEDEKDRSREMDIDAKYNG